MFSDIIKGWYLTSVTFAVKIIGLMRRGLKEIRDIFVLVVAFTRGSHKMYEGNRITSTNQRAIEKNARCALNFLIPKENQINSVHEDARELHREVKGTGDIKLPGTLMGISIGGSNRILAHLKHARTFTVKIKASGMSGHYYAAKNTRESGKISGGYARSAILYTTDRASKYQHDRFEFTYV